MELVLTDLSGSEFGRATAEVQSKSGHLAGVGFLGRGREIADLHVLEHALAQRGHDVLLSWRWIGLGESRILPLVRSLSGHSTRLVSGSAERSDRGHSILGAERSDAQDNARSASTTAQRPRHLNSGRALSEVLPRSGLVQCAF
jgi:hypothetical protein